jgi:hypothetical protein
VIDTIQTSRISLDKIYLQNTQIFYHSLKHNLIGKEYETGVIGEISEKYYKNDPWKYKINKYGFRGSNWNFNPAVAFFGCSVTFGWGVETPVSDLVEKESNQQALNLGIPGASIVQIIKTFVTIARLYPLTHAFMCLPPMHRIFLPTTTQDYYKWHSVFSFNSTDKKFFKNLYSIWTDDVIFSYIVDYIDWANQVAESKKIKIYWTEWGNQTCLIEKITDNYFLMPILDTKARDGDHPGLDYMKKYAEKSLNLL